MIELVIKGGPVMVPLLLCSVISLSIIVERCLSLRRHRILRYDILQRIEELLRDRKIPEASTLCKRYPSSMTRILLAAILNHDKSRQEIKEIIEDAGTSGDAGAGALSDDSGHDRQHRRLARAAGHGDGHDPYLQLPLRPSATAIPRPSPAASQRRWSPRPRG